MHAVSVKCKRCSYRDWNSGFVVKKQFQPLWRNFVYPSARHHNYATMSIISLELGTSSRVLSHIFMKLGNLFRTLRLKTMYINAKHLMLVNTHVALSWVYPNHLIARRTAYWSPKYTHMVCRTPHVTISWAECNGLKSWAKKVSGNS